MIFRFCFALFFSTCAQAAIADCLNDHVHLSGDLGKAQFSVEVADDNAERALGLMNRPEMALSHGMLFIFETEQPAAFWMKNTLIPLDILYFDAKGRLLNIAENAIPGDLTPLASAGPTKYVLEINGGLSKRMGLDESTQLEHLDLKKEQIPGVCG